MSHCALAVSGSHERKESARLKGVSSKVTRIKQTGALRLRYLMKERHIQREKRHKGRLRERKSPKPLIM